MSTPPPVGTWTFTSMGFLRMSSGIGMEILARIRSFRGTARAGGDGIAVRARLRMAEEAADAFIKLGTDDVLKFAGLRIRFGIGDGKGIRKEPLGEPAAANHVASAALAGIGKVNFRIADRDEAKNREALKRALGIRIKGMEACELGALARLRAEP